jgi:hypothetical protein
LNLEEESGIEFDALKLDIPPDRTTKSKPKAIRQETELQPQYIGKDIQH